MSRGYTELESAWFRGPAADSPYRDEHPVLTWYCEMDLALSYALRRPRLARQCALNAARAAGVAGRPDLASRANDVLAALAS